MSSKPKVATPVFIARELLKETELSEEAQAVGLGIVRALAIDSMRAEITMFEAARAYAASDGRALATASDIRVVAPMALRQRRSEFMATYFKQQQDESKLIEAQFDTLAGKQNDNK